MLFLFISKSVSFSDAATDWQALPPDVAFDQGVYTQIPPGSRIKQVSCPICTVNASLDVINSSNNTNELLLLESAEQVRLLIVLFFMFQSTLGAEFDSETLSTGRCRAVLKTGEYLELHLFLIIESSVTI